MESPQSPLIIFRQNHIDTSRAEILVQCLNDKIKEKEFKLQKLIRINDEKKKRNEILENEKIQLTTKLTQIEHENSTREQQLETEQIRIKELQFNIQMLDDHNSKTLENFLLKTTLSTIDSIKRDCTNEVQKYKHEKLTLISKFERMKQQWSEMFKPQYEQSKVYQYLKKGDINYNLLVERKQTILNQQKLVYKDYLMRREKYCNEKTFHISIVSIAKYYLSRHYQLMKINQMKDKLIELENKRKQLIESKIDKMKAWENVYTQPMKPDLMDFCLQTNIEQTLTLSFNQIQHDLDLQPMTPIELQNEEIELVPDEQTDIETKLTRSMIQNESVQQSIRSSLFQSVASTISNVSTESTRSSVLHLTTAIDDNDHAVFSKSSHRKIPTAQMEQMTINDNFPSSTQAFEVSINSNFEANRDVVLIPEDDPSSTQAFATVSTSKPSEPIFVRDLDAPTDNIDDSESMSIPPTTDSIVNKLHPTVTFQLPPLRIPNRSESSIQPQVTSNDVQQMLLTFSPNRSSMDGEQSQPMEDDQEQIQQRSTVSISSSIQSTEDEYAAFNYNFGFSGSTKDDNSVGGRGLTSPINFGNWTNLDSSIRTGSTDQFPPFLLQTNNAVNTSFSFTSFNYGDVGNRETSTDGSFNSFFFGHSADSMSTEQAHDERMD